MKSNIASDWEVGFFVGPREGLVLTGNLARRNTGVGGGGAFDLVYPLSGGVVTKNTAIANWSPGFQIWDASVAFTFSKNTALGNDIGVEVRALGGAVTLSKNNLFGNGDRGAGANCGLYIDNVSGSAPLTVNATGNFWGAATGPGANPADLAGGAGCSWDSGGGITLTTAPVATTKQPLYPPKMK